MVCKVVKDCGVRVICENDVVERDGVFRRVEREEKGMGGNFF
jgi:hypothetical protein